MKYFFKKIVLFSTPIFIYISIALYIDPFNIIKEEKIPKLIELESQISYKLNYPLYKLKKYSDNPTDIIFLGDSRTNDLNTEIVENITTVPTTNLAFAGGTLSEIIETFWYVTEIHTLKEIYIGINFNLYNAGNNMNRVNEALHLKDHPISYLFSPYCFKSTFLILKSLITNETINIEKPSLDREAFWEYQLESSANNFYRKYSYPNKYYAELQEISSYCKKNNMKLTFFIPPTHSDLQEKVKEFSLEAEESKYKADLANLGLFYDFDYLNSITKNKNNYIDPFHFNDSIGLIVIKEIVTGHTYHARTTE